MILLFTILSNSSQSMGLVLPFSFFWHATNSPCLQVKSKPVSMMPKVFAQVLVYLCLVSKRIVVAETYHDPYISLNFSMLYSLLCIFFCIIPIHIWSLIETLTSSMKVDMIRVKSSASLGSTLEKVIGPHQTLGKLFAWPIPPLDHCLVSYRPWL